MPVPVIIIFDVGKTNKKLLLFDEQYNVIHEESTQLNETIDEDGFPCEDVDALTNWIQQKFLEILLRKDVEVKAINFSAYGASFVYLDKNKKPETALYNYLKPYPQNLQKQFYTTYGGENLVAKQTASPVSGSLNSGLQLYRLKYEQPEVYDQIKHALHLPQYLSYIISSKLASDITSIGCHTHLWNFNENKYHDWVFKEGLNKKFSPIINSRATVTITHHNKKIEVGVGLHDSSVALIPYQAAFIEPFVLISTGTWCISLNPFNHSALTDEELHNDCLCYLSYDGKLVKASRLFAGYEHEQQVKRLTAHFKTPADYYKTVEFDNALIKKLDQINTKQQPGTPISIKQSYFKERDLNNFKTYEEAYHQLISEIIIQQKQSTKLILNETHTKRIFVDGGFSNNKVYMSLLAAVFPGMEIFAANIPQASAFGAALAIHEQWNKNPIPNNLINLKHFKTSEALF